MSTNAANLAQATSNASSSPEITTFIRSPEEVYTVRAYLLRWLPLELADVIMDEARYWPTIVSRTSSDSPVLWYVLEVLNNYLCVVYTPRLDADWTSGERYPAVRIKEVCFTIASCDQGWTTDPGPFQTAYGGSFTWFQAVVARNFADLPAPFNSSSSILLPPVADVGLRIQQSIRQHKIRDTGENNKIASIWNIQNNARASPFYRTHRVVWSAEDDKGSAADDSDARKYDFTTGAYRAAGFVQELMPGDRIGIVVRAQKRAWQNIGASAGIEIIYSR